VHLLSCFEPVWLHINLCIFRQVQVVPLMHSAVTCVLLLAGMVGCNFFWVCCICERELGVDYYFFFSEAS
jgi:hypothetical protein